MGSVSNLPDNELSSDLEGKEGAQSLNSLLRQASQTSTSVPHAMALLKYALSLQPQRAIPPHHDNDWHDVLARFCQSLVGFDRDPEGLNYFLLQHVGDVIEVMHIVGSAIERMNTESLTSDNTTALVEESCMEVDMVRGFHQYSCLLHHFLFLVDIAINYHYYAPESSATSEHRQEFRRYLSRYVRQRSHGGRTMLHLAVDPSAAAAYVEDDDAIRKWLPGLRTVELLLTCGMDPDATDDNGETALHICARRATLRSACSSGGKNDVMHLTSQTALILLDAGAHIDVRNCCRKTPADIVTSAVGTAASNPEVQSALNGFLQLTTINRSSHATLLCLAASAIRSQGVPYSMGMVPRRLVAFIDMH